MHSEQGKQPDSLNRLRTTLETTYRPRWNLTPITEIVIMICGVLQIEIWKYKAKLQP
jgi:hypothetical protein